MGDTFSYLDILLPVLVKITSLYYYKWACSVKSRIKSQSVKAGKTFRFVSYL